MSICTCTQDVSMCALFAFSRTKTRQKQLNLHKKSDIYRKENTFPFIFRHQHWSRMQCSRQNQHNLISLKIKDVKGVELHGMKVSILLSVTMLDFCYYALVPR
jgi:hypothetical protein